MDFTDAAIKLYTKKNTAIERKDKSKGCIKSRVIQQRKIMNTSMHRLI
jgi:hypothetical protein